MEKATSAGKHLPIEQMELFLLFDGVSNWCWGQVSSWPLIAQKSMGDQLIRLADSICANLVEGDGRYGVAEGLRFLFIARASARETRFWIGKSVSRLLISEVEGEAALASLRKATALLNNLIRYRNDRGAFEVKETLSAYPVDVFSEAI